MTAQAVQAPTAAKVRTLPVIEVFGPTVQGEGTLAGLSTFFVRFGGCDYLCSWCDSMYAVDPVQVRANAVKLTPEEIGNRIGALVQGPEWVTLSGGNPALLDLDPLVNVLHARGLRTAVETQGSRWKPWLARVDSLTISPKPPSSGMADKVKKDLPAFLETASLVRERRSRDALKIVVFDDDDLEFARWAFGSYPTWPRFLSCGTGLGEPLEDTAARYRWLCELVACNPAFKTTRVLPQLHVVAWGHARGV